MWILLAAVVVAAMVYSIPAALRTYRGSELEETVRTYLEKRSDTVETQMMYYQANLFFLSPEENGTLILSPRSIEIGYSNGLDLLIEGLLEGPSLEELQEGTITLIPEATTLRGSSIIRNVAYIEFGAELQVPGSFGNEGTEYACRQIAATARSLPYIEECVILIDGATFYYENASLYQ